MMHLWVRESLKDKFGKNNPGMYRNKLSLLVNSKVLKEGLLNDSLDYECLLEFEAKSERLEILCNGSSLGRYVFGSEISYNKAPPRLPGLGC